MKNSRKEVESISERLLRGDWPHTRDGRRWVKSSSTFERLCFYAKKLLKLGMTPDEVTHMIVDLYWDAFAEFKAMPHEEEGRGNNRTVPYFDEYDIMFAVTCDDLSPEILKRDYKFNGNAFVRGGKVYKTQRGGSAGVSPLDHFMNIVRTDNNFAFGPTKKQSGWSIDTLAEHNAIGLYKRKDEV